MENKEKRGNVTIVTYDYDLTREQLVRFHLWFYCWVSGTQLTTREMNICTLLGLTGKISITKFIELCLKHKVFKDEDTGRNALSVLCKNKQLIVKQPMSNNGTEKALFISPEINLSAEENTLLNVRCFFGDRSKIEIT